MLRAIEEGSLFIDYEIDGVRHMSKKIEVEFFHDIDVLLSESLVEHAKIDIAVFPCVPSASRSEEYHSLRLTIPYDPIHD